MVDRKGKKTIFRGWKRFLPAAGLILFTILCRDLRAQEPLRDQPVELAVVLDCSQSMKDVDGTYRAHEFARELAAALPQNYQIGCVGYQEDVIFSIPASGGYEQMKETLDQIRYQQYGNAGAGMAEGLKLFQNPESAKRLLLISDGEIMMRRKEQTEESAALFHQALVQAKAEGIPVDVIALGEAIEEGETVYQAAEETGGELYWLADGEALGDFTETYLFERLKLPARPIGKIEGSGGELRIRLPDCLMDRARILLTGSQENENLTVNCEADKLNILKGSHYTLLELEHPQSEEITVSMEAGKGMSVSAYLMAEYSYRLQTSVTYDPETAQARIAVQAENGEKRNLLEGHIGEKGISLRAGGEESSFELKEGQLILYRNAAADEQVELEIGFQDNFGIYFGNPVTTAEIIVPPVEEPEPKIDWFFWTVILLFAAALAVLFFLSGKRRKALPRRRMIDQSRTLPPEKAGRGSDFYGKIMVYVIRNREDIDFPPASVNLFARCTREVITLEWVLEACNIPLNLKGADQIILKAGDDKSLIIKNNGRAAVMKGRELLAKGHAYHLYFQEKATIIFDQEDTEMEIHYKDLKPNER